MSDTSSEKPAFLLAGGLKTIGASLVRQLSFSFSGVQKPLIAYIGAANGDSILFFKMMKSFLMKAGAGKVVFVRLAKDNINVDEVKDVLSSADIIFISGGEVEDGMNWLKKHSLVDYLKDLYAGNKQFVGVSAGSIMLGSHWVRWENPKDDATSELFDCLGIIPEVFDTHAEDEDWIELKAVLKLLGNGARGYGIPIGGLVSADSRGALENLEKAVLTYSNDEGQIRKLEN